MLCRRSCLILEGMAEKVQNMDVSRWHDEHGNPLSRERQLELENAMLKSQLKNQPDYEHAFRILGIKFRVEGSPWTLIAGGLTMLGWEFGTTRMTIGHMLMTDDEFAKEFRNGALMDLVDKHKEEYVRYTTRESKLINIIPDYIKGLRMHLALGSEVAKRGVTFGEALRNLRPGHWGIMAGSVLSMGYGLHMLNQQNKASLAHVGIDDGLSKIYASDISHEGALSDQDMNKQLEIQ